MSYAPDRRGRRGNGGRQGPYDRPPQQQGGGGGGGWRGGDFRGPPPQQQQQQFRGGGGPSSFRGPPPPFHQPPQAPPAPPQEKIDRTKICPLLLRVYIQNDSHHAASLFATPASSPVSDSIVVYTWRDATLRELAGLIQQVNADARSPQRDISFAFIYPDRTGTNVVKHVSTIPAVPKRPRNGRGGRGGGGAAAALAAAGDNKTLQELKFETGDSLSVALLKK